MGQVFPGAFRNEHWDYGTSIQEKRIVSRDFLVLLGMSTVTMVGTSNQDQRIVGQGFPCFF